MKQEVFIEKLKESLFESSPDIGLGTSLKDLDGWDSLGRLSVVALLQEGFGIVVDTKTLMSFHTVEDIVSLVRDKLDV